MNTSQRFHPVLALLLSLSSASLFAQVPAPIRLEKGSRILLDLETTLDSSTTREGEPVYARVRHDITVDDRIALPRGTRIRGTAIRVEPAIVNAKPKAAEIRVRLTEVFLNNGKDLSIDAELLKFRPETAASGTNPATQTALPAILLGGALGGRLGLALGTAAAIGISRAPQQRPKGSEVVLLSGAVIETRLSKPLVIPDPSLLNPAAASASNSSQAVTQTAGLAPSTAATTPSTVSAPLPPALDLAPTGGLDAASNTVASSPATAPATNENQAIVETRATTSSATGNFTIRVNVKLVQVDAVIQDPNGKPITIVQKEDFRVFDNGIEQQIQVYSRDELPLAVALVIDRSGSVAPLMNRIQAAAFRALRQLKGTDRVSLFSFAADVALLEPLTNNFQRVANRIGGIQGGGGTRIVDAVSEALNYLEQEAPDQRRVVILISDNVEGSSFTSVDQAVQHALETEAVVYSVKINTNPSASIPGIPVGGLRLPGTRTSNMPATPRYDPVSTITRDTGGEVFDASASEVDAALAMAVTRLKLRYTLGYYPARSASGRYHGIEVRLADRFGRPGVDYTVLSRRGYYE